MATTLARILKYGLQSFRRNSLISVATIIVMVLALLVFQGLIIFNAVTKTAIASLNDKIDVSVYFKTSVSEDDILKIEKALESLKEVKRVDYISRDRALEIFQELHKDDPTITEAIKISEENPLLASLNIKANDPNDYASILNYFNDPNVKPLIERIPDAKNRNVIDRLNRIVAVIKGIGLGLTIFLAVTAIIVTFNTIRLAIYSNREEIGIMRLVGASNTFINGPYFVEAVIFGVIAAVISLIVAAPFISFSSPHVQSFIPEMNLETYFYGNLGLLFLYQVFFSVFLGIVSGAIATRQYLKL